MTQLRPLAWDVSHSISQDLRESGLCGRLLGPEVSGRKLGRRQERAAQGRVPDNEAMEPGFERQVEDVAEEAITSEMTYGETEAQRGAVQD